MKTHPKVLFVKVNEIAMALEQLPALNIKNYLQNS